MLQRRSLASRRRIKRTASAFGIGDRHFLRRGAIALTPSLANHRHHGRSRNDGSSCERLGSRALELPLCYVVPSVELPLTNRTAVTPDQLSQSHPLEFVAPGRRRAARTTSVIGGSAKFDSPPPLHGSSPSGAAPWPSLRRRAIGSCTTIH